MFAIATDRVKTFLCIFETYFLTKVHKNWMHDYWNENTSNDIFHFSISFKELKFQPIGFLARHFFWKLTQMLILTLFFRISGGLTKTANTVWFFYYKNKNIYNFYAFTIKTDFWNKSGNRRLRRENKAKPSQSTHFATFFFSKKPLYLLKNEKH